MGVVTNIKNISMPTLRVTLLMVTQGFRIMVTKECRIVVTADLY